MAGEGKRLRWLLALLIILVVGWALYPKLRPMVLQEENSRIRRAVATAEATGCFGCHGPAGKGGVPNPGAGENVPALWNVSSETLISGSGASSVVAKAGGANSTGYEQVGAVSPAGALADAPEGSGAEEQPLAPDQFARAVREFIHSGLSSELQHNPAFLKEYEKHALHMSAFADRLSPDKIEDLVHFVTAASRVPEPADPQARAGEELVLHWSCYSCHQVRGGGGIENPGSFKGYIPGWLGSDYDQLVANDQELMGWIRDGNIPRFASNRAAMYFLERQNVQMIAYGKYLSDSDLDKVAAFVRWLHAEGKAGRI